MRLIAICLLLVACSTITRTEVVSSTDRAVVVQHWRHESTKAFSMASAECRKAGRVAVLDRATCPDEPCLSQYRCE